MQRLTLALLLAAAASVAQAQVTVEDAWIRSTVPGQKVTAGYMVIKSATTATLVGGTTAAAKVLELHETRMEGNVARMVAVPRLALPAGKSVVFKPGGYHLMLIDLAKPLAKGDKVALTLKIEQPGKPVQQVKVDAEVRDLVTGGMKGMKGMEGMH